ncbi:MAG: J domain-containing protein [Candidatus Saganbacteria bacterium]|nr:J domain-containing protein [Candidatus Saganbacteria bacterium]
MKPSAADIEKAKNVLGLGEKASLPVIKAAYRGLAQKWHPDSCPEKDKQHCQEKMKRINQAYETIRKYIEDYQYPLAEEAMTKDDPAAFWQQRFGRDSAWGG